MMTDLTRRKALEMRRERGGWGLGPSVSGGRVQAAIKAALAASSPPLTIDTVHHFLLHGARGVAIVAADGAHGATRSESEAR
jgi:hypothetical protein